MTSSEIVHRGTRTVVPIAAANDVLPTSDRSDTAFSASECISVEDDNQGSLDTKINNENMPIVVETETSSTTANEDDMYKMRANIPSNQFTPAKIEFKRVKNKPRKCLCLQTPRKQKSDRVNAGEDQRLLENKIVKTPPKQLGEDHNNTFMSRLKRSFVKMKQTSLLVQTQSPRTQRRQDPEKIDIYYFDHGNAAYFRTTDSPPTILSEVLAQQTTHYATRFWAEIFGSLHIGVAFFITFFLQAYRFILYSIVRAIIVGFFQMTSDYLLKPILTVIFNGLIQPFLILIYNVLSSVKDMLEPIAESMNSFIKPFATLVRALRFVSVNTKTIVYKKSMENNSDEMVEKV